MLFLMNDVLLDVDLRSVAPPLDSVRFRALSLPFVLDLGCELFAEVPLLPHVDPGRAQRLAALILCKRPQVNAALFEAPVTGCRPAEVAYRLAEVAPNLIHDLEAQQRGKGLSPFTVDQHVWRRMAA